MYNPTPKVTIDTELEIFINNSSLILNFTPRLTHQESTRQDIEIFIDQPSHANVMVYHSTEIISDYNHDIWKYQFHELFPYGCSDLDEQRPIRLGL
jgi:hypothetical protein